MTAAFIIIGKLVASALILGAVMLIDRYLLARELVRDPYTDGDL